MDVVDGLLDVALPRLLVIEHGHHRRAGLHRLARRERGRKDFVVDLDELERAQRDVDGVGGHRGHLLPRVRDILGERRLRNHVPVRAPVLGVVLGQDRAHAGQRGGGRHIDARDAGVRVRRAQHLGVQHSRQAHVGRIHRAAGHLLPCVAAVDGRSDDPQVAVEGGRDVAFHEQPRGLVRAHRAPPRARSRSAYAAAMVAFTVFG
jgi:hypothetical protein